MKTPKGDPSTSAEALEYLGKVYPDQPFLQDLLKLRELKKLQSSYIESFKAKHVDGVVYGSFNQAATVTGRFSSSEPNHQNAPASADSGYDIRGLFKPRSGMVYVCADYSQIELRMAAYLSGDPILVDAYANDKDLHQETADAIGCDRKTAKIIGFSLLYGTTSHGLAPRLGVTKQEAENLITAYFDKHKGVKAFMDQAVVSVQRLGYVKSILGRRRRFPEYMEAVRSGEKWLTSRIERQTGNFRVQSSAADLMKKAMVDLDLAKFGAHMLLTVHDELVIECPETNAVACSAHVKEIMENALDLTPIPIKVDPKIGNRWLK
jgi:DNA polymerase-1